MRFEKRRVFSIGVSGEGSELRTRQSFISKDMLVNYLIPNQFYETNDRDN